MNKKVLVVIVAVLVLILAAGIIFVTQAGKSTPEAQPTVSQDSNVETEGAGETQQNQQLVENDSETEDAPVDATLPPEEEDNFEIPTGTEDTALIPGMPEVEMPVDDDGKVTYEEYHAMSGEQQAAFINTFESYDAFFEWYNAAEQEYKDNMKPIDGSTPIELG